MRSNRIKMETNYLPRMARRCRLNPLEPFGPRGCRMYPIGPPSDAPHSYDFLPTSGLVPGLVPS